MRPSTEMTRAASDRQPGGEADPAQDGRAGPTCWPRCWRRPGIRRLIRDVTERRRLEEQLRQAQKMEAVGRLAGGVAHDFNNLADGHPRLQPSSLLRPPRQATRCAATLEQILQRRASAPPALTRQLLAFSRKQIVHPQVLDLNDVVRGRRADAAAADRRGHRARDRAAARTSAGARPTRGQLEQVIMNLAVNARDAMPDGGTLHDRDRERRARRGHADAARARARPGRYVMLAVSDTGSGMTAEIARAASSSRSSRPRSRARAPAWAWRPSTAS